MKIDVATLRNDAATAKVLETAPDAIIKLI